VRSGLDELDDFDRVFGALAHETRRHVLVVLRARGGSMTSGEIAGRFHASWPTVTRHLQVLQAAGLVTVERRGRERVYHLEAERLRAVTDGWLGYFRE
jgi:DNA-binding transcriptional ArsR family regulator